MTKPRIQLGDRFGRLVVIKREANNRFGQTRWLCQCDCGSLTVSPSSSLGTGHSLSCGCLRNENRVKATKLNITHGRTRTAEYHVWTGMKQRCLNPKVSCWDRYGGRGISVCDRWRDSFENFLVDMGLRPSAEHSIERKDNNGNYEPDNCVWATPVEQGRNTSVNRMITFNGETATIPEWADRLGIKYNTLHKRLVYRDWSIAESLTRKVNR